MYAVHMPGLESALDSVWRPWCASIIAVVQITERGSWPAVGPVGMPMFLSGFHIHTSARHHRGQRRYRQTATAEQRRLGFGDELESNSTKINSWRARVRAQDQRYLEMGSTGWLEPGSTTRSHPRSPPSHTHLKTGQHVRVLGPMLIV